MSEHLDLPDGVEEADVAERAASLGLRFEGLQTYRAGGVDEPSTRRPAMVVGFGSPAGRPLRGGRRRSRGRHHRRGRRRC